MDYYMIPVWCFIDANAILSAVYAGKLQPGTLDAPTPLWNAGDQNQFVSMICPRPFVKDLDGGAELSMQIPSGSTLQLMINTFLPEQNSASLITLNPNTPDVMAPATLSAIPATLWENAGTPSQQWQQYNNYVLRSNVYGDRGSVTGFNVVFQLASMNGDNLGYFFWDPQINVI